MMNASRYGSVALRVMFGVLTPLCVVESAWVSWSAFREGPAFLGVFMIGLLIFWLWLTDFALRDGPRVHLTEEGVRVRFLFRQHFCPWSEIAQAGIVYRSTYRGDRNWPCLLLPGGSPMGEKDSTFIFRNYGKIAWIRNSPEVLDFVRAHYGELDFDQSRRL